MMITILFRRRRGSRGVWHPTLRGLRDGRGGYVEGNLCNHDLFGVDCEEVFAGAIPADWQGRVCVDGREALGWAVAPVGCSPAAAVRNLEGAAREAKP